MSINKKTFAAISKAICIALALILCAWGLCGFDFKESNVDEKVKVSGEIKNPSTDAKTATGFVIKMINADESETFQFTTGSDKKYKDGKFGWSDVTVGKYTIEVTKTGYKKITDSIDVVDQGESKFQIDTINVEPIKYTVKYSANCSDATGEVEAKNHKYDCSDTIRSNKFSRNGYNFASWNTSPDGSGQSYTEKQEVSNLTDTDGTTITLYAQWTKKEGGGGGGGGKGDDSKTDTSTKKASSNSKKSSSDSDNTNNSKNKDKDTQNSESTKNSKSEDSGTNENSSNNVVLWAALGGLGGSIIGSSITCVVIYLLSRKKQKK